MSAEIGASDNICVPVPAENPAEGLRFLEGIASGNVGAGLKMTSLGQTLPDIRQEYLKSNNKCSTTRW
ncbi:hypothetical protein [Marinobacter sp. CA1]|uniref:hypothetical protein n=1 Tax=Marinobacter sp. CA1 TaxID=2817656 RepID=UPI001D07FE76|nr:hypothetical protein [Marinobacter sp. CA1]UDL05322.1 hypothetical protein J2887_00620 [Marinobacter sp. CA1]